MTLKIKRMIGAVLALVLCTALIPYIAEPVQAETVGLTIEQLRQKFPHGKYWNHADNPGASNEVNNQDGYSSTPCSRHGTIGTARQTCNGFQPGDRQLSWQCMGYAEKLGYDATGLSPRDSRSGWYIDRSPSALDNLKPGDIVRYRYDGHSIYITDVNGDTVTYTDCNSDGRCVIQWDATVSMAALRASFTYVHVAPTSQTPGPVVCDCSEEYAGTYICATSSTDLNIRSGHGSHYGIIGAIPPGAVVTVTKASGTGDSDWAHVTYNGVTGYASMQYLSKKQENQERDSRMGIWLSDTAMGDSIRTVRTGEPLYLCYKIYDANTGDLFDSYNTSGGYTAKLTLYGPGGSAEETRTFTNDNNCIFIQGNTPGRYKGELVFTWDSGASSTTRVYIDMIYEPRVSASVSDIQLDLEGVSSRTITVSYSGTTNAGSVYLDCTAEGDCFRYEWGIRTDNTVPLTVTGLCGGNGNITIALRDADTDEVLATTVIYVSVIAPAQEPEMEWVQATLSLEGNIGMNFYVTLNETLANDAGTVMRFVSNGETLDVPLGQADFREGKYIFTCPVNAKNMADDVTAQMYSSDGAVGDVKSLSVRDYAMYMIRTNSDPSIVKLMKAMLNYGTAAQVMFNHKTDDPANKEMSEADRVLAEADASAYAHSVIGSEEGIRAYNATLVLETETTVRVFFQLTGNKTIDQYTFQVNGERAQPIARGDLYYIEIPNIAAQDLDNIYSVNVGGLTIRYGGLSYVNQINNLADATSVQKDLAKSLFAYCKAAEDYFSSL